MLGRQDETDAIKLFLQESKNGGCLWITGGKGAGKKMCVRNVLQMYPHIEVDIEKTKEGLNQNDTPAYIKAFTLQIEFPDSKNKENLDLKSSGAK